MRGVDLSCKNEVHTMKRVTFNFREMSSDDATSLHNGLDENQLVLAVALCGSPNRRLCTATARPYLQKLDDKGEFGLPKRMPLAAKHFIFMWARSSELFANKRQRTCGLTPKETLPCGLRRDRGIGGNSFTRTRAMY
jgi:hypothetical protein